MNKFTPDNFDDDGYTLLMAAARSMTREKLSVSNGALDEQ
jgi:hypothetical protein